jgi:ATP-dependent RNA helicase DeaD
MPFPALHPALARALDAQGYAEPTPVQAAVLGAAGDRDLLVSAQTGSGKTVAFGIAMASTLLDGRDRFGPPEAPLGLVIAPTRELALQVERELSWLFAQTGARILTCVGGMDPRREARALAGGCHLVVGTPGRLRDHLERGNLDVSALSVVVLDEADEMLDLGFREDLELILDAAPAERRSLLFSATLPREITELARRYQTGAERIDTVGKREPHGDIEYRAIRVAPNEVEHAVVNVLRYFDSPGALVFCSTREAVRRLHGSLVERGFAAVALSGELSQNERNHALQALRDGRARVGVCTDVAARGLDLPELGLVVHADLPGSRETLTHRSGRTGRAGRKGVSLLIVPFTRRRRAEQLLASAHVDAVWTGAPTAEEIRAKDQDRLLADPALNEPLADDELALARRLLEGRTPEQVAAALIRLQRAQLPAPEDLYDPGPAPQRERREGEYGGPERGGRAPWKRREAGDGPAEPGGEGTAWFRLTIGRNKNADPKWLIPLICRLGHVTKKEIGAIRVFERETRFEIVAEAAERFAATVEGAAERDARIEPAGPPSAGPPSRGPRPKRPEGRERPAAQRERPGPGGPGPGFKRRAKPQSEGGSAPPRRKPRP